ncbi:hypothetical protein M8C21_029035, partial [Ambrosia artemisiifolia]
MAHMKPMELDEGWNFMQSGIQKLKKILEGHPEQFTSEEYMMLYTTIYNMCTQKPPHDYSQQLYEKYKEAFEEYIRSTVLPSLREKHDEFMLRELVKRWANHKIMVRWLSRFFHYLDRYFITRRSLPALNEVGLTCFRVSVYEETKGKARDAVIALIDQEREGEQIDRALLKNVLGIYVEIGMGQMDCYVQDFEAHMLADTAAYYSRKASNWIVQDSCPDYMLKNVQNELLVTYSSQLLEKEHSGCRTLLQDDKVEDLTRMFRLFSKIPKGLDPVANMFKQHVTAEGMSLVQQAEDAASNKAENVGGPQEQVFVRKIIELHDKFMTYVTDCFSNHTLFHKALKEAFEVFCNKVVAGFSSAELLASYCDNILKKGGSEKLSDEAIEETLDKAAALLLFNGSDRLSFSEIKTQLNLADEDVVRLLQSLSCAKYKILIKEPPSRTVSETDYFQFNSKFTDRMRRIRIPLPPVDERKKVVEDVDKDRRYAIDAAIVRIMKSRKTLGHQQLVSECVEQLGRMFKPDFKAIKKRIEDLITREYLERDKENPNVF